VKYLDEYRDQKVARGLIEAIKRVVSRPWVLMEVCGGQTHSIVRYGIDRLLPPEVDLVHGPGCPVCVTALETLDRAHAIAARPEVIFTSFGDMLRVPGSTGDLLSLRARGADIRVVYSPLDALKVARQNPDRQVVFFGVGFETTAPANAMALLQAHRQKLTNFSMLVSHVLVPPAMASILQSAHNRVQAFLGPGHVCAVMGYRQYESIASRFRVPVVVTGFEPVDLLEGILMALRQLESDRAEVENQYVRTVTRDGNRAARDLCDQVFEVTDRAWRGIGVIGKSGYRIRHELRLHDAEQRFEATTITAREPQSCMSGLILRGLRKPSDCPELGRRCTPRNPLGATMVSSEGACAAYFAHGRYPGQALDETVAPTVAP
jgi:hydrogenase expression/formation protein HypD